MGKLGGEKVQFAWRVRNYEAEGFVFVIAACFTAIKTLPDGRNAHTTIQSAAWWRDQMAEAALRNPGVEWRIGCDFKGLLGKKTEMHGAAG